MNDLIAISENEFLASNDHFFDADSVMTKMYMLTRVPLTNVVYVKLDESLQSVVETRTLYRGFHGANGLGYRMTLKNMMSILEGQVLIFLDVFQKLSRPYQYLISLENWASPPPHLCPFGL